MTKIDAAHPPHGNADANTDPASTGMLEVLTWLGEGKRMIAGLTALSLVMAVAVALLLPPIYTARTSLLPPTGQGQAGSASALAALGSLGGLATGLGGKTPDELYVALLKSDSVVRGLDKKFDLKARYKVKTHEALRKTFSNAVRVSSEKKSGVIAVEVEDEDPAFAAELANAHLSEVTRVLDRLAVSEAQQRRAFFDKQVKATKDHLIAAESELRRVQERSGVIVLDKQAEALIAGAAQLRGLITEREVQLKVMRTGATDLNPDVVRLSSELTALRGELKRMESSQSGNPGSSVDLPVGQIPAAAIEYVRARRELKLQETLLEAMVRQFELAKLDEAKEGPSLQTIDKATPPELKSKPSRVLVVLVGILLGLLVSSTWVVLRAYTRQRAASRAQYLPAWASLRRAWRLRA